MSFETGGIVRSSVLNADERKKIERDTGEYQETLEKYGFKSPVDVWNTYILDKMESNKKHEADFS